MTDLPPPAPQSLLPRLIDLVFGQRLPADLPAVAQRAIVADRRASEILVCLIQFGAIAFFGTFYALTPKAFPPSVPFEPVPWALAAYFVFTTLRLWLALRDRLGPVFLSLSILVDITVLMVTIWSFHLQYQQPAAFYLKAPTLLYVFILIAMRTLRLEAAYVILAGVAAVIGWSILVAYAVIADGTMEITRSFVEYMMSFKILIGAEVDKLVSIASVTGVLAIGAIRARRLMIRSAVETHAAAELSRFLSPEVAGEIRRASADFRPGDAVTREAAVMMLDLRGFTGHAAQLGPLGTMALLAEFHACVVPVLQRHGGSIDKYLGDGIMATFGATEHSQTYAADALYALMDLQPVVREWQAARAQAGAPPVGLGAAVTVGEVLFGVTGEATRLEFTVIGTAVNLAAKIEKHCKPLGRPALASAEALAVAIAQGFTQADAFEPLPAQQVDGTEGMLDLVAVKPAPSPSP